MTKPLLEVRNLKRYFPITAGFRRKVVGHVKAVDGVSFQIAEGETLGLVGESGCGKTTTGKLVLRLIERTEGEILFHDNGSVIDLAALRGEELRRHRRHMQLIFQDPFSSLNPRMTVYDIIAEPLKAHGGLTRKDIQDRVKELIQAVGLNIEFMPRYPHAFSGGQRQRIGIARALALNPRLIVCDEPVSALDVSVQAQILNLLKDLQDRLGLSYLFIAHDLTVVENISATTAVMYAGRIVEMAPTETLFRHPKHPYTETLLAAVPKPDPEFREKEAVPKGEVADPSSLPPGCPFHPRCPYAQDRCRAELPALRAMGSAEHTAACHFSEGLALKGIESERNE
ncbi:MAG: ABC transporter ATP-binding protein [Candidatus Hydrogenedentes bacterium]|nr:ABC transporter ATP-binding protein [Candidatus Hydrogenedentota bacterium]